MAKIIKMKDLLEGGKGSGPQKGKKKKKGLGDFFADKVKKNIDKINKAREMGKKQKKEGYDLGRVYTDKDRPPFKVNKSQKTDLNHIYSEDVKITEEKLIKLVKEEMLKEGGRFKLSGRSEMQWDRNKIRIMTRKGQIALDKKELYNLLRGAKMHHLADGVVKEDFGSNVKQIKSYSSKEAKNIIDGALRKYAKELRKAQYKVIKDWMAKAKAGVIDYFDVVRGLQVGDASRAYSYETDFLMAVLNKDKIIDRFRKYFGGMKGKKGRKGGR